MKQSINIQTCFIPVLSLTLHMFSMFILQTYIADKTYRDICPYNIEKTHIQIDISTNTKKDIKTHQEMYIEKLHAHT